METLLWIIWPVLVLGSVFYLGSLVFAIGSRSKVIVADLALLSKTIAENAPEQIETQPAIAHVGADYGELLMQRFKLVASRGKQKAKRQRRLIERIKSIEIEEGRFR